MYSKSAASVDAPWGKFTLFFHKACDGKESREKITEKLREMALEKQPG